MCKGGSHLECKDTDHRFMITDTVLHVAGVQILSDLQRILFILLYLLDPPYISIHPLFLLFVLRGVFGSQPPQNPVSPGRFPFLRAVIKGDVVKGARESRNALVSKESQNQSACVSLQQMIHYQYHINYKYSIYKLVINCWFND